MKDYIELQRKVEKMNEAELVPYKQGVTGSNPVPPTK